jgi:hypothetical protein
MTFQKMFECINAYGKAKQVDPRTQNRQNTYTFEEAKAFLKKMKNWSGEHGGKNK